MSQLSTYPIQLAEILLREMNQSTDISGHSERYRVAIQ